MAANKKEKAVVPKERNSTNVPVGHALYKTESRDVLKRKEEVPKFSKQRALFSKPTKTMNKAPFYETYWTDRKLIETQLSKGKLLAGRLFFDPEQKPKVIGYVMPDPIISDDGEQSLQILPIKIFGIRYLNRCHHLDRVYVKFVNWVEWGKAANKTVKTIDFLQHDKLIDYVTA